MNKLLNLAFVIALVWTSVDFFPQEATQIVKVSITLGFFVGVPVFVAAINSPIIWALVFGSAIGRAARKHN